MKPVVVGVRAKGLGNYLARGQAIVKGYGLTSLRMVHALDQFIRILEQFHCNATCPVTASVVMRHSRDFERCAARGMEFAIHGYHHIDHSQLPYEQLVHDLYRAKMAFSAAGIPASGFRLPYLQFNGHLRRAAEETGLDYLSNQSIAWDVVPAGSVTPSALAAYERAIEFYGAWPSVESPSLPRMYGTLVEIPISLPDDEMLLDRLNDGGGGLAEQAWSRLLAETYEREELFTLMLHPERTARCALALSQLLSAAQSLDPPVWVARMNQISAWWRARSGSEVSIDDTAEGDLRIRWNGPEGLAILARNVEVRGQTRPWTQGYRRIESQPVVLSSRIRPFVGLPRSTPADWPALLRQLGYIVETSSESHAYSVYLDQLGPAPEITRSLLARIEEGNRPLVKLGRWPGDARSALAITGDIDALTIWDYGLRFLGH
ncbi:MAG: polysaccharide deacetylase family protein [Chloroflexi bacterium]|nr:polysaccharide deacetylase family protein [Chloroflexota bacterium]